jgi:hypothetical protein
MLRSQQEISRHRTTRIVHALAGHFCTRVQALAGLLATTVAITFLALTGAAGAATGQGHTRMSVHSSPTSVSVRRGRSTRSRLRVSVRNTSGRSVSISISRLPRGVRAAISPATVKPGHAATLILDTTASTRIGSYRLRVVAVSIPTRRHAADLSASLAAAGSATQRVHTPAGTESINLPLHVVAGPASAHAASAPSFIPASGHVPTHIETWSYDDDCNGGVGATPTLVRAWLTYAESNCGAGDTHALTDCHENGTTYCTAIQYMDANMIYNSGSVPIAADAQENWWVHQPGQTDSAHRLTFDGSYGAGQLLDQANPAVQSWFHKYAQSNYDSFDGLMMDDTGASQSEQFYGSNQSSSQELPSNSSVLSEHRQMAAALTHSNGSSFMQVDNGLNVNPWTKPAFGLLNSGGVVGLMAEGDPIDNGTITSYYSTLLDDMSYIDHTQSDFLVLLSYDPSGSQQARRIQAATVLLGYSPGHIVSWSDLEQNNDDLQVWPEEGIYPTNPVQSMGTPAGSGCLAGNGQVCSTGGHNDLQVAPGVYRREFGDCYDKGTSFGNCAVIVNDTSSPVTIQHSWLTLNYTHQITLNGGDVQSGGTVDPAGATYTPGTTTVPADDAALLSS